MFTAPIAIPIIASFSEIPPIINARQLPQPVDDAAFAHFRGLRPHDGRAALEPKPIIELRPQPWHTFDGMHVRR